MKERSTLTEWPFDTTFNFFFFFVIVTSKYEQLKFENFRKFETFRKWC